jgi:hypothetical protein
MPPSSALIASLISADCVAGAAVGAPSLHVSAHHGAPTPLSPQVPRGDEPRRRRGRWRAFPYTAERSVEAAAAFWGALIASLISCMLGCADCLPHQLPYGVRSNGSDAWERHLLMTY